MRAAFYRIVRSVWVLRIVFALASVWVSQTSPLAFVIVLWAGAVWFGPLLISRGLPPPREPPRSDEITDALLVEFLEMQLTDARQEIGRLQNEVEVARLSAANQSRGCDGKGHPLFRRVGLDQDCPKWVALAVRRAYRGRLHPDKWPPDRKAEAERRFKDAEAVFNEVWRVRGFS